VSLALGLAFNHFFYDKLPGLAFPVFVALFVAGLFAVSGFTRQRISRPAKWLLAPLALFSVMVSVRASLPLTLLNVAASLMLLLVIADTALKPVVHRRNH
jgi:asparagine N-glycosylation enzyme membrane subunit Stt3